MFQRQGVHGTSLEEICANADVSVRTFFNHFETRESLHEAIAHKRAHEFGALLDEWSSKPGSFVEKFQQLFGAIASYLTERPAYRDFVGEMLHLRPARGNEAVRSGALGEAMHRLIEQGVATGEITSDYDPAVLADLTLGALTMAITNWSASDDYELDRGLRDASRALIGLFGASNP